LSFMKEKVIDFILEKNDLDNLMELFNSLEIQNANNSITNVQNHREYFPYINDKPDFYSYISTFFFDSLYHVITNDGAWAKFLDEFVNDHFQNFVTKGDERVSNLEEFLLILNKLIGKKKSDDIYNDGLYNIDMTEDFVKNTQYKPLSDISNEKKEEIRLIEEDSENGVVHLIYACPDGHLHASNNCGIPVTISKCGYPTNNNNGTCQHYVGGIYHMLVPGNYIVKHDGYQLGYIYYGKFPIYTYKMYKKILEQANNAAKNWNDKFKPLGKKDMLGNFQVFENIDDSITAKKYNPDDQNQVRRRSDNNFECFVCGDELVENGDDELYILPCGHLIHKVCLATARGLNANEDMDIINDEVDVSGRLCPHLSCNRNRFLFSQKQSLRRNRKRLKRKNKFVDFATRVVRKGAQPKTALKVQKQHPAMTPRRSIKKQIKRDIRGAKSNKVWYKIQNQLNDNNEKEEKVINKKAVKTGKIKSELKKAQQSIKPTGSSFGKGMVSAKGNKFLESTQKYAALKNMYIVGARLVKPRKYMFLTYRFDVGKKKWVSAKNGKLLGRWLSVRQIKNMKAYKGKVSKECIKSFMSLNYLYPNMNNKNDILLKPLKPRYFGVVKN